MWAGQTITGKVTEHQHFGFFLDLGLEFPGLILVVNIGNPGNEVVDETVFPDIGASMEARVLGFNELDKQITLYWPELGKLFESTE